MWKISVSGDGAGQATGAAEGKSKSTEKERQHVWVQGTTVKSIPWKHRLHGWLEGPINWKGWLGVRQRKALNAQQGCVYLTQFGMGSHSRSLGSDITRSKLCLVNSNEAAMRRWLGEWETESSVQLLSWVRLFVTPWTASRQASLSPTPEACSNSCPLNRWCPPTISSSVVPFSSCLQSFPASGSYPMTQFFASGGQSIGVSASASVLPMKFPLEIRLVGSPCSPRDSQESSSKTQFKNISSLVLNFLYGPTLTSIHDYWKKP